jgi:murein DD-endopeptidase MepM/ murein hydrolase activator NlpD
MPTPLNFGQSFHVRFSSLAVRVGFAVLLAGITLQPLAAEPNIEDKDPVNVQLMDYKPTSVEAESYSQEDVQIARRLASFNPVTQGRVSGRGYRWPVRGAILSPFGPRGGRIHPGLDIDGNPGDPVGASRAGMVIVAGPKYSGYGNMVDILHEDGVVTRYAHATRVLVRVGQQVQQGEPIMTVGCTGRCSGPHVHFEVRIGGHVTNPLPYLR